MEPGFCSARSSALGERDFPRQGRRKQSGRAEQIFLRRNVTSRSHRPPAFQCRRQEPWHQFAPIPLCLVLLCTANWQAASGLTQTRHSESITGVARQEHRNRYLLQRRFLSQRVLPPYSGLLQPHRSLQSAEASPYPAPNTSYSLPCSPAATCQGTLQPNSHVYSARQECACSPPLVLVMGLDETSAQSHPLSLSAGLSNALCLGLAAKLAVAPSQAWLASLSGTPGRFRTATVWVFPATVLHWSPSNTLLLVDRAQSSSAVLGAPGVIRSLLNANVGSAVTQQAQRRQMLTAEGTPSAAPETPESTPAPSTSGAPAWSIAVIAVLAVLLVGTSSLALLLLWKLRKAERAKGSDADTAKEDKKALIEAGNGEHVEGVDDLGRVPSAPKPKPMTSEFSAKVAESFVKAITLEEIVGATGNFAESNALGSGGYGTVYKGLGPGGVLWAVKRAKNACQEGVEDFQNEVDVISKMSHRNLVKLLGYCDDQGEQILVYEFVPNGTLRQHIRPDNPSFAPLTFQQRLEIAVGSAEGLKYLHSAAEPAIIHRDIKCDNILLDQDIQAKVADFGVFKRSPTEGGKMMNTRVVGTPGYVDPEYYQTYKVTVKSDVYSFGVVLLELITGRPPIMEDPTVENESYMVTLSRWAAPKIAAGKVETIVDPRLHGTYPRQALNMMAAITAMCVRRLGRDRPEMAEVATRLAEIKYFLKPSSGILEPVMNLFPEDRDDADNLNEIPEEDEDEGSPENIPGVAGGNPYSTSDIAAPVSMVFSDR